MFANLLTTTTSRYNALRQQLTASEADGDTEDDSHISRVLRAYYKEKEQPLPPWLPPDPRERPSAPSVTSFVSSSRPQMQQQASSVSNRGSGGALGDLWDAPRQGAQPQPQSLRQQGRGSSFVGANQPSPGQAPNTRPSGGGFIDSYQRPSSGDTLQARP